MARWHKVVPVADLVSGITLKIIVLLFSVSIKSVLKWRKLCNCWDWDKSTMVFLLDLTKLPSTCWDWLNHTFLGGKLLNFQMFSFMHISVLLSVWTACLGYIDSRSAMMNFRLNDNLIIDQLSGWALPIFRLFFVYSVFFNCFGRVYLFFDVVFYHAKISNEKIIYRFTQKLIFLGNFSCKISGIGK